MVDPGETRGHGFQIFFLVLFAFYEKRNIFKLKLQKNILITFNFHFYMKKLRDCPFRERYLQIIWNERFLCSHPKILDGRELRIVSSGIWNRGKGPDFRGAVILLGDRVYRGDVELHRYSSEWFLHGHAGDPAYADVILHVVWCDDLSGHEEKCTGIPTLELRSQLLSGWESLFESVEMTFYPHSREIPPGACALRWALSDDDHLKRILSAAGYARFQRHGRELLRRGMEIDLAQSLYERIFDALGYSANREQFRQLSQALPLSVLQCYRQNVNALLSLVFGVSGLLPDPTTTTVLPELQSWLSGAWKTWWNSGLTAMEIPWNRYGSRPLNSVYRRLAAGALWLYRCQCDPLSWLDECLSLSGGDSKSLLQGLLSPLSNESPWDGIRDFQHALMPRPATLIGIDRRRDIALNVLLPFLGARAELQGDSATEAIARGAWELLPRPQSNQRLQEAALRFLTPPSRWHALITNAAQQQGMMDIYQNFCLALDHDCNECPFVVTPETT